MPYMVQQAAFHNMPLAIASALDTPTYEEINRELQSVFYWWEFANSGITADLS